MIVSSGEARPIDAGESSHRQLQVGTTEPTSGRLRRRREDRYRIGTKWISNMDADYRSDSYRPHLLTARTHGGVTTVHA